MSRLNVGASVRGAAMVLLCLVAQLSLPARPVAAHAFLESSDPVANAVLPTAPQSVTLTFTEPLETSYSRAELFDETGAQVPGATSTIGPEPRSMTVQIPPGLGNGTYSLLWRTLSTVDGHTAQGYLPFTIGTEADVRIVAPPAVETTSGALPEWALSVARWLALLGMAAVAAVWPVWLFVVRPAISPAWQLGPKLTRRVRRYATGAFAFSLVANLVALVVQAAAISGPADLLDGLTTTLGDTRYGTWWLVRVGVLLVFAAVLLGTAWWWPWRRRPATILALVASAALPLPFSMISHAGAEPAGQATAVAFDYVHLLGASLWAGGLLFLAVALAPTVRDLTAAGRRVVLGRALPRFSLLALIAWGVMGFTGLYSAWLQVGNIPALTGTPYGQTLILKLILIVPLLALGAFNLAVVTRKLRVAETEERVEGWSNHFVSALIAEVVIVTLLLGVVGMLIGTPPARQVMEQQAGSLRMALEAGGQTGTLIITPGTVGPNHYRLELGSGHEAHLRNPAVTDASLRLSLPERQTGQIDVPLRSAPSGGYEAHGSELAFPGDWQMQLTVRMPGQPDWVVSTTQPISTSAAPAQIPSPPPLFGVAGVAALVLLVLGIVGIAFALIGGTPVFRKEAAGLGTAAIVAGIVLLFQARLSTGAVAAIDPAVRSGRARSRGCRARRCAFFAELRSVPRRRRPGRWPGCRLIDQTSGRSHYRARHTAQRRRLRLLDRERDRGNRYAGVRPRAGGWTDPGCDRLHPQLAADRAAGAGRAWTGRVHCRSAHARRFRDAGARSGAGGDRRTPPKPAVNRWTRPRVPRSPLPRASWLPARMPEISCAGSHSIATIASASPTLMVRRVRSR